MRAEAPRYGTLEGLGGQAANGHFTQDVFLLAGAFDDLGKRGEKLLLVVDEPTGGGEFAAAGEFADIPRVLSEEVEGAFGPGADKVVGVVALGLLESIESAVTESDFAGIDERPHLE